MKLRRGDLVESTKTKNVACYRGSRAVVIEDTYFGNEEDNKDCVCVKWVASYGTTTRNEQEDGWYPIRMFKLVERLGRLK